MQEDFVASTISRSWKFLAVAVLAAIRLLTVGVRLTP